jgi:hypothetical protein
MNQTYYVAGGILFVLFVYFLMQNNEKPKQKSPKRIVPSPRNQCTWGPWNPCDAANQQTRYAVQASDSDTTRFDCGLVRKSENRTCPQSNCESSLLPYCVCTEYDTQGECTARETRYGKCDDYENYKQGACGQTQECTFGPWLACDSGKQTRYAVYASLLDTHKFPCGETQKFESRACLDTMCTTDYIPYCACDRYDLNNNCTSRRTVYGGCGILGTSEYKDGQCSINNTVE